MEKLKKGNSVRFQYSSVLDTAFVVITLGCLKQWISDFTNQFRTGQPPLRVVGERDVSNRLESGPLRRRLTLVLLSHKWQRLCPTVFTRYHLLLIEPNLPLLVVKYLAKRRNLRRQVPEARPLLCQFFSFQSKELSLERKGYQLPLC